MIIKEGMNNLGRWRGSLSSSARLRRRCWNKLLQSQEYLPSLLRCCYPCKACISRAFLACDAVRLAMCLYFDHWWHGSGSDVAVCLLALPCFLCCCAVCTCPWSDCRAFWLTALCQVVIASGGSYLSVHHNSSHCIIFQVTVCSDTFFRSQIFDGHWGLSFLCIYIRLVCEIKYIFSPRR